ncbi:hypothetical protein [Claveliimonas bilis]|uniref:Uncharacterized protein n=1 Tax=Claveliimonas bilis TaxID=3028070 RepID=A0ABN6YVF3_9FIRM|nr:hypothetical protein [Claveliimonas bilis]BDZ76950.1 hypothetical protein Lac1_11330 [Claveliimonas bilis]
MTIDDLNNNLEEIIKDYETNAGKACSYCYDDSVGEALKASHDATVKAFRSFKAEILTYLNQH